MRSIPARVLVVFISLIIAGGRALAHGGGHAPPPPPPKPPSHKGPPKTPPGDTTPTTPGPGGPKSPGPITPGPGGSPGPRSAPAPVTGPGMGPLTPGGGGPNLESWTYWWSFNKERFLKLHEKIGAPSGPTTDGGESTNNPKAVGNLHPTKEQLTNEVAPALLTILDKETDAQILAAAMIAAAKIGVREKEVFERLRKLLSHSNSIVTENAALSLGILAYGDATALLVSLFEDSTRGRELCNQSKEVPWRIRTIAAISLGLAATGTKNPHHRQTIQSALLKTFVDTNKKQAHDDVGVAAVLALGMVPDPDGIGVAALEKYFNTNFEKEEIICGHIPPAIAKILQNAAATERERYARALLPLTGANSEKGPPRYVRCGRAIAFGMLTTARDSFAADITKELRANIEEQLSKYPESVYLSIISLGEIAGTGPAGSEIEKFLAARASMEGGRVMTRAWSAIALGVERFLQIESGHDAIQRDPIPELLLSKMLELRDPEQRAAFGVALGLCGAKQAGPALLRCIDDVKVDDFRGYFALAVGMIDGREHIPTIQKIVKDSTRKPGLFQQSAIGLGLMGDKSVVPLLVNILSDGRAQTFIIQSAVADSLGYVGDYRAVAPLVELLYDVKKEKTSLGRTFAAVALGLVGDKDAQPWNTKISQQLNYFAFVETLTDLIWEQ